MEEYPAHSKAFIQQANRHRILLQKQFRLDSPPVEQVLPHFLNLHLLLYENKYTIDSSQALQKNTSNILEMVAQQVDHEHKQTNSRNKFTVGWSKSTNDKKLPEKAEAEMLEQPKTAFHISHRKEQLSAWKSNQNEEDKRKKNVEFVSANVLPKGTSIRKKFVPPFKKAEKDEQKAMKENKDGDDEMDPMFKNLEAKLVQIIESQIVEREQKIEWKQIAGLGFAKKVIHEMIVWPMLRPDIFTGLRAPPRGILLFGPPGTGKTMIGRAIASEASATFFSISASSLTSKWVGQSEKLVKTLFAVARARQPSVIFIDQVDSILCSRKQGEQDSSRRVKTEFLIELDGAKTNNEERILIIGATNLPQELDDAVRRRFVKRLYIPLPNLEGRKQLLRTLTDNPSFYLSDVDIENIAVMTKGYSGADMYTLCSEASMMPLRMLSSIKDIRTSEVPTAKLAHFEEALTLVRPSVNIELLHSFQSWNKSFGSYQLSPDQLQQCPDNQFGFGIKENKL